MARDMRVNTEGERSVKVWFHDPTSNHINYRHMEIYENVVGVHYEQHGVMVVHNPKIESVTHKASRMVFIPYDKFETLEDTTLYESGSDLEVVNDP